MQSPSISAEYLERMWRSSDLRDLIEKVLVHYIGIGFRYLFSAGRRTSHLHPLVEIFKEEDLADPQKKEYHKREQYKVNPYLEFQRQFTFCAADLFKLQTCIPFLSE